MPETKKDTREEVYREINELYNQFSYLVYELNSSNNYTNKDMRNTINKLIVKLELMKTLY